MATWTLANIKAKLNRDLANVDESFITSDEMTDFINEAIRTAEASIHKLGIEDEYYLTKSTITLVNAQETYDFPTDIYADKIRNLTYINGTRRYPVTRLKGRFKFEEYHERAYNPTNTEDYKYLLTNHGTNGRKITLSPPAYENLTDGITIWYIRNAKELTATTDVCDIPEFINFIFQYVKVRAYEKEVGHPNLQKAMMDLEKEQRLMVETLTDQVPDGDNLMEQDLSVYQEMT